MNGRRIYDPTELEIAVEGCRIIRIWGNADHCTLDLDNGWSLVIEADESELCCYLMREEADSEP